MDMLLEEEEDSKTFGSHRSRQVDKWVERRGRRSVKTYFLLGRVGPK